MLPPTASHEYHINDSQKQNLSPVFSGAEVVHTTNDMVLRVKVKRRIFILKLCRHLTNVQSSKAVLTTLYLKLADSLGQFFRHLRQ